MKGFEMKGFEMKDFKMKNVFAGCTGLSNMTKIMILVRKWAHYI